MDFDLRFYMIFSISEINMIDFSQVLEDSPDTVRKSVDGTKTFVKWEGEIPSSVTSLTTKEGPYNHEEMLNIVSSSFWTPPLI